MPVHVTTTTTQSLSNKTFVDRLSTTGVAYASGGNSNQWNSSYSTVTATSASWNPAGRYLPLSGGALVGNLTISGNLSCNGTQTFNNTVFSTTSAVSVVHVGSGPALWVGNNGTGDIASFYDIDQNVEVLHVGGINSTFPNVGVKTSNPNVDFTVKGAISASSIIYDATGDSNQWNSSYSTIQSQSANNISVYSTVNSSSATTWNYQGTDIKALTGNWQNTYTNFSTQSAKNDSVYSTVQSNSANWAVVEDANTVIGLSMFL
jgi:hypothetical protein